MEEKRQDRRKKGKLSEGEKEVWGKIRERLSGERKRRNNEEEEK